MSEINGDEARFNRNRKRKIARRKRTREQLHQAEKPKSTTRASGSKGQAVEL